MTRPTPQVPGSERSSCPDCSVDRRDFLAAVAAGAVAVGAGPLLSGHAVAAPKRDSRAESAVTRLYETLTVPQRKEMVLAWDDPRRTRISANWKITKATVGTFSPEQRKIIDEILAGVTSEDGYDRLKKQMADDSGGVEDYAIAIFGKPDDERFAFELTGRHLTLRADGDTTPGAAFGGPIVYGHGETGNSKDNLFFHQTLAANEVFKALDGEQRKKALLARAPAENAVQLREDITQIPGISGKELSDDQKELVKKVLGTILAPYRKEDVDEALAVLEAGGGIDSLQMAFYQSGDLDDDGVWDVWRLESPTLVCHFRGAPHVHAYINIARRS